MTFPPLIIWAKARFFFQQLFLVVARTWLGLKSVCLFLGPKFWFLAKKSNFGHTTPILVDDPFLALGMTVNFPPWKPFFDFPFRSYNCFRKKIRLTRQKVLPPPTMGALSASNSPSALSARAGWIQSHFVPAVIFSFQMTRRTDSVQIQKLNQKWNFYFAFCKIIRIDL